MIVSCRQHPSGHYNSSRKQELPDKYKKGDIVYLKPDSLEVVIIAKCPCEKRKYTVSYNDKDRHEVKREVEEELIFSKK
jgi:hypothetical protein